MAIKRWLGLAGALVIIGGALYSGLRREAPEAAAPRTGVDESVLASASPSPGGLSESPLPSPSVDVVSPQEAEVEDAAENSSIAPLEFPTLEKVRAETAENPHATPPSLIQFARDLAPRMEEALSSQDPRVVRRMVFALKACALSDSKNALPQVQAMCISNWKRVVEAREKEVPGLRDELSRSKNLIPPDAQRLIDASNAMLKPSGDE